MVRLCMDYSDGEARSGRIMIDAGGGLDGWWGDGNKEGVSMALSFVYSGFYYYYSNMLCAAVLLSSFFSCTWPAELWCAG